MKFVLSLLLALPLLAADNPQWGGAANGGLRYYILDNEPSIWFSTRAADRADVAIVSAYSNQASVRVK